ncbi:arginine:ornithine antiporter [Spirochaetia bacterium]|nr:arginine:ornithine antiporter [Spirochaetia bacterium]
MADVSGNPLEKKGLKSPNAYVVLFLIICIVAVLTWFVPGGQYELNEKGQAIAGTYHRVDSKPQGLWNIFMAPITGMIGNKTLSGAIAVSLNVLLFGSFLAMVDASGALKAFLKKISRKNKGNSHKLIAVLVIFMALLGTITGTYEEGFVYILMFMPIIIGLGLDTLVTLSIVVIGSQMGCLASIINPFATGIASGIAGITPGDGIALRVILFIITIGASIVFICRYADKIKKDPEKSLQYYRWDEDKKEFASSESEDVTITKQQKRVLGLFALLVLVMVVSLVPWDELNSKWDFFVKFTEWVTAIPVLGAILGTSMVPFGWWYFNELNMFLIVISLLAGFAMNYKIDKTVGIIIQGAKDLVGTALIIPLARGIQVVMNDGLITPTILNLGEVGLGGMSPVLFAVILLLFYLPLALFIPSSTGLAAATMSIIASLARFVGLPVEIAIIAYLMALGLIKMIAPTSIVVMTGTQIAHVEYTTWVKFIFKFIIFILVLCCAFLAVTSIIS